MTEDRTFLQIITRVKKLFPDKNIEVSKTYVSDIDGLSIFYEMFVEGMLEETVDNFVDLCHIASDFLGEHDVVFQRRKYLHDRNWSELFKLDGRGGDNGGAT